jgi:hypothetical protein
VSQTVGVVLAAIAFKALLDRLFNHIKKTAVQYITQKQVKKMQDDIQKQMEEAQGKSRRKREWNIDDSHRIGGYWIDIDQGTY